MEPDISISQHIYAENNIDEKLLFRTSANFLCNFMKKPEYLKQIIRDMAIKPRYVEEQIEYLGIPSFKTITFPMTCFCDIPLTKVSHHMSNYGNYGIALNKNYCISKDVQPITYINKNSRLCADLSETFRKLFSSAELPDDLKIYPNMLLGYLLYMKPIDGPMRRGDEQPEHYLFKDECEWRYIPQLLETEKQSMPLIMNPHDNTEKGRKVYSEALAKDKSTWFKFDVDKIEYIIVPDEANAIDMIKAINGLQPSGTVRAYLGFVFAL